MKRNTALEKCLVGCCLILLFGLHPASAQVSVTIEAVLLDGDVVDGVGAVTAIDNFAIIDNGDWLIEADTDNSDTAIDNVLLMNGYLLLREGDALSAPPGASIGFFDTVNLNINGNSGWNFSLDGTMGGSDDSGVYFNTILLIQESDLSTASDLSPDTPYIGFFEAKINDSDELLLMASVDDPLINSSVDRALMLLEVDTGGALLSETVVVKEGDTLTGQLETVTDFDTSPHNFDFNNAGQVLVLADLTGAAETNAAVYLIDGATQTLLAQEGSPSPLSGRLWENLASPELSLNNAGSWVFSGNLDGDTATDQIIVRDDVKVVQEGDTLADIVPFPIDTFGSAPILQSDTGNLLWYGEWNDPDGDIDSGLFYNHQLIVQEGVTEVDGIVIDTLRGVQEGFTMSPDGSLILFEAVLDDGRDGAFLVTVAPSEGLVQLPPVPGRAGVVNLFTATGAAPGSSVGFVIGPTPGATAIPVCAGESFEIGGPIRFIGSATADANGEAKLSTPIPGTASGKDILSQAVETGVCNVSNLVLETY